MSTPFFARKDVVDDLIMPRDLLCTPHEETWQCEQYFESIGSAMRVPFGTSKPFSGEGQSSLPSARVSYNGRTRMFSKSFRQDLYENGNRQWRRKAKVDLTLTHF
jgi:hypothetical protein